MTERIRAAVDDGFLDVAIVARIFVEDEDGSTVQLCVVDRGDECSIADLGFMRWTTRDGEETPELAPADCEKILFELIGRAAVKTRGGIFAQPPDGV